MGCKWCGPDTGCGVGGIRREPECADFPEPLIGGIRLTPIPPYRATALLRRIQRELQLGQAAVEAAPAHQIGVPAFLDDAAVVHHQNATGALHGGEAMGDDEGGATLREAL